MTNRQPLPVLVADDQPPMPIPENQTDRMLQMAIQQGMPVESLKELVALRNDELKRLAKAAYVRAMAKFQALVPVIEKTKKVGFEHKDGGGRTNYRYAPLWKIAETIKEALRECDLSYRWEIQDKQEGAANIITVTCIVTHVDGHSEQNPMSGAPDPSGKKNAIQQRGSTITYLQRYTLIGALGLTTADEDNDGGGPEDEEVEVISDKQYNELHAILTDNGVEGQKASNWLNKLANSIAGCNSIIGLPASKFEEAKEKLKAGLANRGR